MTPEDAERKAAEALAAEYQAKVMQHLMSLLTFTGPSTSFTPSPTTNQTNTNEKETPDSRFN